MGKNIYTSPQITIHYLLHLLPRENEHRPNGLEHVLPAAVVVAEHVAEHHVLEVLHVGAALLAAGEALLPEQLVFQVIDLKGNLCILLPNDGLWSHLVDVLLLLGHRRHLQLPHGGLHVEELLAEVADLDVLVGDFLR